MSLLQVEALQAGYGKKQIIYDISLEVDEGRIVGILGPNGCGKSTMIKALCKGISYQGKVSVCGRDIKEMSEKALARACSYMPQKSGLAIDISVFEVVLMGFFPYMGIFEGPNKKMKNLVCETLSCVGLKKEIHSNFMELSEGQKRLCILARSLVAEAKLLIMDEPDASLDFGIRNHMIQIIKKRVAEKKTGVLLTLHDTDMALSNCDEIYLMKEGRIVNRISSKEESLSNMEQKLSELYGKVKIQEYFSEDGTRKLTMVQA